MKGKGNDGTGNSPKRDSWETPQNLWNQLNKQYHFDFDCCATQFNAKTLEFTNNIETLDLNDINKMCWMNPPFSKAALMFKNFFKSIDRGVAIYRCDNMETKVWQDIILKNATWIFIPKGRILYHLVTDNANGRNGSRFPSALIGYNVNPPIELQGTLLKS